MTEIDSILSDAFEWNFSRSYEPAKPLGAREIARLGNALDDVESLPRWRSDRWDAKHEYFLALRDRVWFEAYKANNVKRVPSMRDGQRLHAERTAAFCRYDELISAHVMTLSDRRLKGGGPTMRELLDARAALALAESKFQIAQRKFRQARKLHKPRPDFVIIRDMKVPVGRTRKKIPHEQA